MKLHRNWVHIRLAFALLGMAAVASPVAHAATLIVVNNNGAGEGFNDPTAAAPVGGNTGTTIGAQRLIAFQAAADIWGGRLSSPVAIRVGAQFNPLTCNATGAVLGSAGPANLFRDFTGAPVASTWYSVALANALHGSDLDAANDDINATFNSTIGTTCPFPLGWYYGLDGNAGSQIDFFSVLVHELGHGLGFLTFVDLASGAKALGFNDTFMLNLENHGASPPDYPSMTDAQRVAASIATGNLHWVGANVMAASGVLTAGTVGDHVQMFAPNPQQPGSSVSHWDTALTPNQIMEPSYTGPLHNPVLEPRSFKDIGWTLAAALPNTHDSSGDGRSDIVWRDTSGNTVVWIMNGAAVTSSGPIGSPPTSWSIVGQRDFNGDRTADLLWRDTSGNTSMWFMKGTTVASTAGLGNVSTVWSVNSTADFNGDGKADILWRDTSGNLAMWFMNGATASSSAGLGNVSNTWTIIATADFNGDGKADILWRDTTGNLAMWFMNGATVSSSAGVGNISAAWSLAGTGDFDGDGKADLLWRDTSGNTALWFMNGATVSSTAGLGNVSNVWSVVQTGDYNDDGHSDIFWRDTSGNTAIWFMVGATVVSSGSLGNISTVWTVQSVNVE